MLLNPTDSARKANITVTRAGGELVAAGLELAVPAHGQTVYDVNSAEHTEAYGVVTVSPDVGNSIFANLIRNRGLEYAMPTPVR